MAQQDFALQGFQAGREPGRFLRGTQDAQRRRGAHWALTLACSTIFFHLSCSMWVNLPNASGVPPTGLAPSLISCWCRPGSAALTPLLMTAITSGGVPLGAKNPNHEPASKSLKPDSATVR